MLDAWPVVEHFKGGEPAAAELAELLVHNRSRPPVMSAVNFTEVCAELAGRVGPVATMQAADDLRRLVSVRPPDHRIAQAASWLKHAYYMALGDTYAAATAISLDAELWTGDPELLCADRIWRARDLRPPDRVRHQPAVARKKTGRRPATLNDLDSEQLAAVIDAVLERTGSRGSRRPLR